MNQSFSYGPSRLRKNRNQPPYGIVLAVILGGVGLLGVVAYLQTEGIDRSPRVSVRPSNAQLIAAAREAVLTQLVAPKTAEFCEPSTVTDRLSGKDTIYRVEGQVDSANKFNAMLRMSWTVELRWPGGKSTPVIESIRID